MHIGTERVYVFSKETHWTCHAYMSNLTVLQCVTLAIVTQALAELEEAGLDATQVSLLSELYAEARKLQEEWSGGAVNGDQTQPAGPTQNTQASRAGMFALGMLSRLLTVLQLMYAVSSFDATMLMHLSFACRPSSHDVCHILCIVLTDRSGNSGNGAMFRQQNLNLCMHWCGIGLHTVGEKRAHYRKLLPLLRMAPIM